MNLPLKRDRWPAEWLELWTERARIMEFDGLMSQEQAELLAEHDVRKLAKAQEYRREERSA